MGDIKDPGWEFLTSNEDEYYDSRGNKGKRYYDGSATYQGADGSHGEIYSDGSGSYHGADGSWGDIYSDGSKSFHEASSSSGGSLLGDLAGTLLFFGALRVVGALFNGKSESTSSTEHKTPSHNTAPKSTATKPPRDPIPLSKEERQRRKAEEQRLKEIERKEHRKAFLAILPFIILLAIVVLLGVGKYMEISKPIPVNISAKDAKGLQYQDVVELLKVDGFSNITTQVDYDLVTGWIRDEGAVKSISIDGESSFKKDDNFPANSKIVIIYHGYKKNNPDKGK